MSQDPPSKRHFHTELDRLQERLLKMAGAVEESLGLALDAVAEKDRSAAKVVRQRDEEIDDVEVEIEEITNELLALHQPMASDLRKIIAALKMSNDLERVGDHAVNIARAARRMAKAAPLPEQRQVTEMGVIARKMLADALHAFVGRDPTLARKVCTTDDQVDELRHSMFRILVTYMLEDPSLISGALEMLRITQSIERVADLATNIAEDVVYMVEGQSIKHGRIGSLADHDATDETEGDEGDED